MKKAAREAYKSALHVAGSPALINQNSSRKVYGFAALMQTLGVESNNQPFDLADSSSSTARPKTGVVPMAAALVALIAFITLSGWVLKIRILQSLGPGLTTMKANTAIGLGLTALALWLAGTPAHRRRHSLLIWVLLAIVSVLAALTLSEYRLHWNAGIDELIFRDPEHYNTSSPPGRLAPATALCLLLLSAALLLIDKMRRVSQGLVLTTVLIALVSLLGYIYDLPTLYGPGRYTSLAIHTIIALFALSLGILASRPDYGLTALLIHSWEQGSTVHTLVAGSVIIPLALGSMVVWGHRSGWYGSEFALALFTALLIIVSVSLVWMTGFEKQSIEAKRVQVQQALIESEERFRAMADNIPNLAWMAHADGNIFWYNRRWYEYTGTTLEQMKGWGWQAVHDPALLPSVSERWEAALSAGSRFEMVFPLRGKDGAYRPFLTRIEPVENEHGLLARWFGTNTDISAERETHAKLEDASSKLAELNTDLALNIATLKESEERLRESLMEKEVLLKEVHHRVKNNLQIISSLLSMQVSQIQEEGAADVLRDSEARVRSMSLIHELLYRNEQFSSVDFSMYVRNLVPLLQESYQKSSGIECILNLLPTELTLEQAIPSALILNELITNSLKYAYPDGHGEILVDLGAEAGWMGITVKDHGVGLPANFDPATANSFGLTIVRALAEQLSGECVFSAGLPGAKCTIRFPLDTSIKESQAASV